VTKAAKNMGLPQKRCHSKVGHGITPNNIQKMPSSQRISQEIPWFVGHGSS
jgi:hypothetical protein